jgi:type IV pilus assembly protein PilY1
MRTRFAVVLLAAVVAWLPGEAAADYLYSAFRDATHEPYVLFILDNSGSMSYDSSNKPGTQTDAYRDANGQRVCPYGVKETEEDCDCRRECVRRVLGFCTQWKTVCDECDTVEICKTRADAAVEVLQEMVANLDATEMGLLRFGTDQSTETCNGSHSESDNRRKACSRVLVAKPGAANARDTILGALPNIEFATNTPIALSLKDAKEIFKEVAEADSSAKCRGYYVILLTDGEDNCCEDPPDRAKDLRSISLTKNGTIDVRTFVIGFGKDVAHSAKLSELARAGGTARKDNQWECWDPTGTRTGVPTTCTEGTAMFAGDTDSLRAALGEVMSAIRHGYFAGMSPVIGSVPQVKSESDRVARNLMAYTAFTMPGYQGHVFGVRLFQEKRVDGKPTNQWEFTDLSDIDDKLANCGTEGNPCIFDAGQSLSLRVRTPGAKPRQIWTSEVFSVEYQDATGSSTNRTDLGIRLVPKAAPLDLSRDSDGVENLRVAADALFKAEPFKTLYDNKNGIEAISTTFKNRVAALRGTTNSAKDQRGTILSWLHGDPALRSWPLGDPYHGGAAIVETPPYPYQTRGYPVFRENLRNRPAMIYVPANDGMIHAFHAGPDLETLHAKNRETPTCSNGERWCPGEEAWAYVPASMLARTAVEVLGGQVERFFSMDLSCRVDDVLVHDNRAKDGGYDCEKDPVDKKYCGWRTVLLCGQGWGGNWFVALDVTDPLKPKGLWELTFDDGNKGFGRTWSLPGIAVIERDGFPIWMAVAGNGYNTDYKPKSGTANRAYRLLNLPFNGSFAHHGDGIAGDDDHVYMFNVADGKMIRRIDTSLSAVVADLPAIDVDRDGFTESVYVAGWGGEIHRIGLGGGDGAREAADPNTWGYCNKLFKLSGNNPLPNRPVMMLDPQRAERLYLIAASGQDKGSFPDDATNLNASYDLEGWFFDDDGGVSCSAVSVPKGNDDGKGNSSGGTGGSGNMCKDPKSGLTMNGLFNQGEGKRRLMGAPIIAGQPNGERWLTFTAWTPPKASCGGDGEGSLYCLKWAADASSCNFCGDLNDDGKVDGEDESIIISREIPPPPISADGQIYVVTEDGLQRVNNQDGKSGSGGRPNSEAPRNVVVSWREVFPSPVVAAEEDAEEGEPGEE